MTAGPAPEVGALGELGPGGVALAVLGDVDRAGAGRVETLDHREVGSLDPGVTSRVTVVWPDTGSDTVVVDVPDGSTSVSDGSTPVRFVDVPVAD